MRPLLGALWLRYSAYAKAMKYRLVRVTLIRFHFL